MSSPFDYIWKVSARYTLIDRKALSLLLIVFNLLGWRLQLQQLVHWQPAWYKLSCCNDCIALTFYLKRSLCVENTFSTPTLSSINNCLSPPATGTGSQKRFVETTAIVAVFAGHCFRHTGSAQKVGLPKNIWNKVVREGPWVNMQHVLLFTSSTKTDASEMSIWHF